MPPTIALAIWFVLLLALLRFDPAKEPNVSWALWVPLIWIFIAGSRLPSQWLSGEVGGRVAEALEEGNTFDRVTFTVLILLAFAVLMSRSFGWGRFLAANIALTALLIFGLLSVSWSDFPFVAFKRWFRDLGTYVVILVALSDPRPLAAIAMLLRRLFYLLIPLCILLDKYFPDIARDYDQWTGQQYFMGATTSKNVLGVLCLVSGLFFFWDTLARWGDRGDQRTKWIILVNVALFAMTLSLMGEAGSATSNVCLVLGCLVIAAAHTRSVNRHPRLLTAMIPVGIGLYLLLQFVFGVDIIAVVSEVVGRNPDLTGRTGIWSAVLSTNTNPYVGTGYDSFWLGARLQSVWEQAGTINEAHNGYLEVYLSQGLIGLFLLAVFLIASYRTICKRLTDPSGIGALGLALWTVLLFYNVTESAFRGHLILVVFLLAVIVVPESRERHPTVTVRRREAAYDERLNTGPSRNGRISSRG